MRRVLILTNSINGLYNFRIELIKKLLDSGFEVIISSPKDAKGAFFSDMSCRVIDTPIERRGINPIRDFNLFVRYIKIISKIKPDIVLTYTIKPNVFGGLCCSLLKIPYIANVTGLGSSIVNKGFVRAISLSLYKLGLRKASKVFFQNSTNKNFFIDNKIIDTDNAKLIPGSGVNISHHFFEEYPPDDKHIRFLFIGRIMRDKGIDELFEAASVIKKSYLNTEFHFIGMKEEDYDDKLNSLASASIIQYFGRQDDVHPFIKECHALINPSYHEGMSNVLLEAASTGRPVLASNIPGCVEAFEEGVSGYGFEARNVQSLVDTIIKFIKLPYEQKKAMGLAGRKKMEKEFDRNIVTNAYMYEINLAIKENANEFI